MVHSFKVRAISLLLCVLFPISVVAQDQLDFSADQADASALRALCCDEGGCNARIELINICAKKIKSLCGDFNKLNTDELCAALANIINLKANSACINNLCVNELSANFVEQCGAYRATVAYAAPSNYVLGSPLAFNTILDDPNNNVSVVPFMTYTAPVSGYYIVTLEVDLHAFIIPGEPVLGVPVANPQVIVNGTPFREGFTTFLTFHDGQHSLVSSLISLKAGDVVSAAYNALAVNDIGFHALVGSATISGNGTEAAQSFFKIHYLSSDCTPNPLCPPCNVPTQCTPCPSTSCCVS